jgi:DNA-binding transcriptional LysR family regulator
MHIARWLESGDVDLSLGWSTSPAASLRSRLLFSDRLVCIARIGHPKLRDNAFTAADYLNLPQVQYDPVARTTTGLVLEEQFARQGVSPGIQIRLQGFSSLPEIIATSNHIATLPCKLALSLANRYPLTIVEPPVELPDVRCAAYWHERMQENPQNRWLRGLLFDAAKNMQQADEEAERQTPRSRGLRGV